VSALDIGLALQTFQTPMTGETPAWEHIRRTAIEAEAMGFNTVWVPDELLWDFEEWGGAHGFWECVAMTGAVAATTSTIEVGTWVLSALHRNPGLTAKAAATIDEISGGRFLFGFGSGHSGGQGKAFGFAPDRVVSRYEEALEIIVPLLREGSVDFDGKYHSASGLKQLPTGPRPTGIPLMLGGHKPRTIGLAVAHADIWSGFATESSLPEAFTGMLSLVDQACEEAGRDPATLGRSIGVWLEAGKTSKAEEMGLGVPLSGTPEQVADSLGAFVEMGVTRVELNLVPGQRQAFDLAAETLSLLDT
jgi:alkanesulfonate monooxygenase SsuD/methylene tetrahydromethanopterin reductase-like flavin-dependent oxidoreductase (luciferase family)